MEQARIRRFHAMIGMIYGSYIVLLFDPLFERQPGFQDIFGFGLVALILFAVIKEIAAFWVPGQLPDWRNAVAMLAGGVPGVASAAWLVTSKNC